MSTMARAETQTFGKRYRARWDTEASGPAKYSSALIGREALRQDAALTARAREDREPRLRAEKMPASNVRIIRTWARK